MDLNGPSDVPLHRASRRSAQRETHQPAPETSARHPEPAFRRPTCSRDTRASSWPYPFSSDQLSASRPAFPQTLVPVAGLPERSEMTERSGLLKLPSSSRTRRVLNVQYHEEETSVRQLLPHSVPLETPSLTNIPKEHPECNMGNAATSSMGDAICLMSRRSGVPPSCMEPKLDADFMYGRRCDRPGRPEPRPEKNPQRLNVVLNVGENPEMKPFPSSGGDLNEDNTDRGRSWTSLTYDISQFGSTETIDDSPAVAKNRIQVKIEVTKKSGDRAFRFGTVSTIADRILGSFLDPATSSISIEADIEQGHLSSIPSANAPSSRAMSNVTYNFSRSLTSSEASALKNIAYKEAKQQLSSESFSDAEERPQMLSLEPSDADVVVPPETRTQPILQQSMTSYETPSPSYPGIHRFSFNTTGNASVSPPTGEFSRSTPNIFPKLSRATKSEPVITRKVQNKIKSEQSLTKVEGTATKKENADVESERPKRPRSEPVKKLAKLPSAATIAALASTPQKEPFRTPSDTVTSVVDTRPFMLSFTRKPVNQLPFSSYSYPVSSCSSTLIGMRTSDGKVADPKRLQTPKEQDVQADVVGKQNIAGQKKQLAAYRSEAANKEPGIANKEIPKPTVKASKKKLVSSDETSLPEMVTLMTDEVWKGQEKPGTLHKEALKPTVNASKKKLTSSHTWLPGIATLKTDELRKGEEKPGTLHKETLKPTVNASKKKLTSSDTWSPEMVTLMTDEVWRGKEKPGTLQRQKIHGNTLKSERQNEMHRREKKEDKPKDQKISKTARNEPVSPEMVTLKTNEVWGEVKKKKSARRKPSRKKKKTGKDGKKSPTSTIEASEQRGSLAVVYSPKEEMPGFTLCCLMLALILSTLLILFTVYLLTTVCVTPKTPTTPSTPLPHTPSGAYYCETDFCLKEAAYLSSLLNATKKPCDNFYNYVCEGWSSNNPLPVPSGAGDVVSRDTMLQEDLIAKLKPLLHSMTDDGVRVAASLSNSCADRTNNRAMDSAREIFNGWSIKSWPELKGFRSSDVWRFAGELIRDLNVAALSDVAVGVNPLSLKETTIVLDKPKLLFSFNDASRYEVTSLFRRALKDTMSSFAPSANAIKDEHVDEVLSVFIRLGSAPAIRLAPDVDSTLYVNVKVINLDTGFKDLLSTVFENILQIDLNMNVVLKSSEFLSNFLVSAVNDLPARALANYIGFLALVRTAPFFPDNLRGLRQLFGRSILGRTLPDVSDYNQLCLLAVESLLPACFVKGSVKLRRTLGADVTIRHWLFQLEAVFSRNLQRVSWINDLSALIVRYYLKRSSVVNFGSILEPCSPLQQFSTDKPLKFFHDVSMLKQQEQLQHIKRGSADLPQRTLQSDLSTRATYDETRQLVHVPMALFNTSVPSNSTMFALHLSRFGVRLYRALVELLFQNNVYELSIPLSFTGEQERILDNLLRCLELDLSQLPPSLHGSVVPSAATSRGALLQHTTAVQLAFRAFQELLQVKRIWNVDFRLKGLPQFSADMLFFVYYALDNCESADVIYKEHLGGWLPAEYRVNMPLRHLNEFGEVFGCAKDSVMMQVVSGKCSVLTRET